MRKKSPPYKSASTFLQRKSPRKIKILIVSSQYVFHFLVWVAFRHGFPIICYNVSCILSPWFFTRDSSTIVHLLVCLQLPHSSLIASSQFPHSFLIASSQFPHSFLIVPSQPKDKSEPRGRRKLRKIQVQMQKHFLRGFEMTLAAVTRQREPRRQESRQQDIRILINY